MLVHCHKPSPSSIERRQSDGMKAQRDQVVWYGGVFTKVTL